MSRYFSFGVLLAVIVLLIIMFYKLMVGFFVPLFLAALLVVIFNPLHKWFLDKCRGRAQIAAGLTTATICLVVFAPMALVFMLAASEGRMVVQRFSSGAIVNQLVDIRRNLKLDVVAVNELRDLENEFNLFILNEDPEAAPDKFLRHLDKVQILADRFRIAAELPEPAGGPNSEQSGAITVAIRNFWSDSPETAWSRFSAALVQLNQAVTESMRTVEQSRPDSGSAGQNRSGNPSTTGEADGDSPPDAEPGTPSAKRPEAVAADPGKLIDDAIRESIRSLDNFKTVHTGGKTWSWLKLMANPDNEKLVDYGNKLSAFMQENLLTIGGATTAAIGGLLFGIVIMIVALYFFLLDGPTMLEAIKHVSPLNKDHDEELIREFSTVSRAVVLATLLSALAQGVLAGIGLWFCGFEQVFLLTILTTCLALVPFVGAAAVWVPACIWLYAMDGRMAAAIGLAIYGTGVISMVDNFIKPWVLHGQSNLHPLLALLSVLGGVTALGPVGILIGPMIVAFLQTTLEILRRELSKLDVPRLAADLPGSATPAGKADLTPVAKPEQADVPKKPSGSKKQKRK